MSDDKDSAAPPRVPHNMTGLLRFALQQTKSEDAPNTAAFNEMDEERKQFLENAFRTMTVDIIEEFEKALNTLESKEASTNQKVEALNVIRDNISSIDFANSFVKLGGTKILIDYAQSEQRELRVIAIAIIAEMAQNNPFSQQHFLDENVLQILLPLFKQNEEVVRNSLYAVSSLIRNFEPGLAKFIEIGGVSALCACLKNNDSKVFIKTGFLIASIATEFPLVRDEFVKKGALDVLLECIDPVRDYDIRTETLLYAVSELTKSEEWHPNEHVKDDLSAALNQLVTATYKLPQCEEMVAYAKQILDNMKGK